MEEGTKRQVYTFAVRKDGDGTPYIACEPVGRQWIGLGKGPLSFVLTMATTHEDAKRIASFLNKKIEMVSFTKISKGDTAESGNPSLTVPH
ncbi:MAG: hypothetical protein ACOWYE_13520 [Desulfatiglandales bacterium]